MYDLDQFTKLGAAQLRGAAVPILSDLLAIVEALPADNAGLRLRGLPDLTRLIGSGTVIASAAERAIGQGAMPVRAILFDKSTATNWSLGWHQDRTICVQQRIDTPGFGPWTIKQGIQHVAPPIGLLEEMVTLRIHLDDVTDKNAPLLIAPGSHRLGRIPETEIAEIVQRCGTLTCTAHSGDVWLYSTPILHASGKAQNPNRRRVLQIDYAATYLPNKLEWAGI